MSEKRFECVFKEHETKNSWSMIKDNQLDKPLYIKDVVDLLNDLYEERNYFERKKCEYWDKFNLAHLDNINLQEENEQLKKEHKIAIDEMISDYKNLEKENEELKSRIAFFEEQEDEFEAYTAQTIQNMIANYRDD